MVRQGAVHTRLEFQYRRFPWQLFRLVDSLPHQRLSLSTSFESVPDCCKDYSCTQKIFSHITCPSQLATGCVFDSLCAAASEISTTTADLERANALNFHLSMGDRRRTSAERIRYESNIQAWVRDFKRRGGNISLGLTENKLKEFGVQTKKVR